MIAVDVTLKKFACVGGSSAVSAGVTIARLVWIGSPSIASETLIGPTSAPDTSAMLPLNVTWYRAKHACGQFTTPRRIIIPDCSR